MKPGTRWLEGQDGGCAPQARAPACLPCLNSNISNEGGIPQELRGEFNRLSTNHRKSAYKLAKSVHRLCSVYGIARVGFFTLTFADHVTCAKEASRRFNSLSTGVLRGRYVETISVLERMGSGRIHFHCLVVLSEDIRTGFDFEAAARGEYTSANGCLRSEWAFWRRTAKDYGFGRTELLPVKSNQEGLSRYVGKYIAKHVGRREQRDKGVRLVRYSRGASVGSNAFMFASPRSRLWREQVKAWATRNGCSDLDQVRERFGARWAYHHRAAIMSIEPPAGIVVGVTKEGDAVSLYDVWHADRIAMADTVARSGVCTQAEAFTALFTEIPRPPLAFELPKWTGERRPLVESEWEKTIVWNDGRVERAGSEDRNPVRKVRREARE